MGQRLPRLLGWGIGTPTWSVSAGRVQLPSWLREELASAGADGLRLGAHRLGLLSLTDSLCFVLQNHRTTIPTHQKRVRAEAPCPCWAVPTDFGDVTKAASEQPWEHSSAEVAAGSDTGTRVAVIDSAFVAGVDTHRERDVDLVGSCPYSRTADA